MLVSTADGVAPRFPAEVHARRRGCACRITVDAHQTHVDCERGGIPKSARSPNLPMPSMVVRRLPFCALNVLLKLFHPTSQVLPSSKTVLGSLPHAESPAAPSL